MQPLVLAATIYPLPPYGVLIECSGFAPPDKQMVKTEYADVSITQTDSIWIFLLCISMLIIGVSIGVIVVYCRCGRCTRRRATLPALSPEQAKRRDEGGSPVFVEGQQGAPDGVVAIEYDQPYHAQLQGATQGTVSP